MDRRILAWSGISFFGAATILLSGCGSMPQTRDEFTHHPRITKTIYTVPRPLNAVVASLQKQARHCINGMSRQVANGGASVTNTGFDMTVEKKGATRAEMTYRISDNVTIGQPQGGFFKFAADLQSTGPHSTKVTLYHGGLFQETLTNAIRKWTEGDDTSCHGYGGS